MNRKELEKVLGARSACGRTLDEQLDAIRTFGNHGASPALRAGALAAHGIVNPKPQAAHAVLFGCNRPFTTPFLLQHALRLLDLLGVEHTWLDKEYCCGLPLLSQSDEANSQELSRAGAGFLRMNSDAAQAKGSSTLVYCCAGCATAALYHCKDDPAAHVYVLDLLLDRIAGKTLRLPARIGYFEGCHATIGMHYRGASLDWTRYREFLDGVEELHVADLPRSMCCKDSAASIVDEAVARGLEAIVSPCSACTASIRDAGRAKGVRMYNYPELLLEALEGTER